MNRQLLNWILIAAGAIAALVLYILFAYMPLAKKLAERKRALAVVQTEIKQIQNVLDNYDYNLERAERIRRERQHLERELPERVQIADLLKDVTRAATECRIQDLKFIPQPLVEEAELARKPVRMTVTCGYHGLGCFLSKLTALPRLVNAGQIQITGRDKTGKTDSITVDMVLETYVQKRR